MSLDNLGYIWDTLESSRVLYSGRHYTPAREGSEIDAMTWAGSRQIHLDFQIGDRRGYKIRLSFHHQDFRKMLDLMLAANRTIALPEMAAAVARALEEDGAGLSGSG